MQGHIVKVEKKVRKRVVRNEVMQGKVMRGSQNRKKVRKGVARIGKFC